MTIVLIILIILVCIIAYLLVQLKQEKEKILKTEKQYEALIEEYIALVKIDVKNDTYEKMKSNPEVDRLLQQNNQQANFQLKTVLSAIIADGEVEELMDFLELSTILERLKNKKIIRYDFQGKYNGWCRAQFMSIDTDKSIVFFSVKQIEEDKNKENQLRFLTENDLLTGLHNETYGVQAVKKQIENRKEGMFCLIEIDDFKTINDQYGSQTGDKVISEIADCLKDSFNSQDILYRRGGARFAVFSKDVQDKQDGRFILKMLESQIAVMDIQNIKITISAGVAFYRVTDAIQYEQLLERAENCLQTSRAINGVSVSYYD